MADRAGVSSRLTTTFRWILAGPMALISSALAMLAMPLWYPPGPGNVDNLVMPLLVFPLIWSVLFFHACLDWHLTRVTLVSVLTAALSAAMIAMKFTGIAFQS